jgi:hypothetical protein
MASEVDEVKQNAVADSVEDSEELFYAAAVQILSEDLYPRKLEIIREYIQNASGALDDWMKISDLIPSDRTEPQIKVSIQGKSVLIFDNGIGMTEEDIPKLQRIAVRGQVLPQHGAIEDTVHEPLDVTSRFAGQWALSFLVFDCLEPVAHGQRFYQSANGLGLLDT